MIPKFETPWLMITGGDVVLPGGDVLSDGTILVNQGIIQSIEEKPPASILLGSADVSIIDAAGHWVTPGLIDQHLHGAFGIDFNQATTEEIHSLLEKLPMHGITGVLPTLITAPKLEMVTALARLEEVIRSIPKNEVRILGIHLEGPFLSPQYKGAHPAEDLLTPSTQNFEGLLSPSLKRITMAPELDHACDFIEQLSQDGILCSIGHSGADYLTTIQAIRSGASCATHLYNAMGRIDHRDPGIVIAALVHDDLFIELIADGKHLSPPIIQMTFKTKPFEKCILISDCNALTGMAPGASMQFGKQKITVYPDGAKNEDGRLAGSTMLITDCVRNLTNWGLLSFPHSVQLATHHPATHLNVSPTLGQLSPGSLADILLWRKSDLALASVFIGGEPIERTPEDAFSE